MSDINAAADGRGPPSSRPRTGEPQSPEPQSPGWYPKDLNQALAIKQTDLAKHLFGDVAIRKWLAAGLTVRKIWEITKAAEVCRKLVEGEKICWICGYGITQEKGLNPHCEHVMPVAAAVLFASLYNTCSLRPENDKFYKAEYLWAHQYCNLIKSDDNLFAVVQDEGGQKLVPNEEVIRALLHKITLNNERLGGYTLRAIIHNDPSWRGRQLLYLKTICQNVIETLHIESSQQFLQRCSANARNIPHLKNSSKYKILLESPPNIKFVHGKNLEEMLLLLVTRTYLQLVRQFFREEQQNPTTNEAIREYMVANQLTYTDSADEQLIVDQPVQFTFNEEEIDAAVRSEVSSPVGQPAEIGVRAEGSSSVGQPAEIGVRAEGSSSVGQPASETAPDSAAIGTSVGSVSDSDDSKGTPKNQIKKPKVEESFFGSPQTLATITSEPGTLASMSAVADESQSPPHMVDTQPQALVEKDGFKELEPLVRRVFGITEDFDEEYGVSMENLEAVITQFVRPDKLTEFVRKADLGGTAPERTLLDAIHTVQMEMCQHYYDQFEVQSRELGARLRNRYNFIRRTLQQKIEFYRDRLTPPQAAARRRTYRNKRPKRRYQSIKISSKRHSLS